MLPADFHQLFTQFQDSPFLLGGISRRPAQQTNAILLKPNEGVGDNKMGFEIGELVKPSIGLGVVRTLVAEEGNKEAELGDLRGDGLDVHPINTVLHQVKLPMIHIFLITQITKELNETVKQAHGEGTGTTGRVNGLERLEAFANLGLRGNRQLDDGLGVVAEKDIEGLGVSHGGQGGAEGLVDHVVDDFARSIEGTGGLARRLPCLGVIGGKEVFEDLAEELGVEGDIGIGGMVLVDGEIVALQQREKTALGIEEKEVRKEGTLIGATGKTVVVDLTITIVLFLPI